MPTVNWPLCGEIDEDDGDVCIEPAGHDGPHHADDGKIESWWCNDGTDVLTGQEAN